MEKNTPGLIKMTIYALSSGPGISGIAVIRVSGKNTAQVIKTGSPMMEILNFSMKKIKNSNILKKLDLKSNEYFVASIHREENVDNKNKLKIIVDTFNKIAKKYDKKIILSLHPRTKNKLIKFKLSFSEHIIDLPPFGFNDYIHLQKNAKCVISDSGTITEEAAILNFPAITIREASERPEGFDTCDFNNKELKSKFNANVNKIKLQNLISIRKEKKV